MPDARQTSILSHPEAVGREDLAAHYAFETTATVTEAVAAMRAAGRDLTGAAALAGAETARRILGLPANAEADQAIAQRLAAAAKGDRAEAARKASEAQKFATEYEEGHRTAARLLGKRLH